MLVNSLYSLAQVAVIIHGIEYDEHSLPQEVERDLVRTKDQLELNTVVTEMNSGQSSLPEIPLFVDRELLCKLSTDSFPDKHKTIINIEGYLIPVIRYGPYLEVGMVRNQRDFVIGGQTVDTLTPLIQRGFDNYNYFHLSRSPLTYYTGPIKLGGTILPPLIITGKLVSNYQSLGIEKLRDLTPEVRTTIANHGLYFRVWKHSVSVWLHPNSTIKILDLVPKAGKKIPDLFKVITSLFHYHHVIDKR